MGVNIFIDFEMNPIEKKYSEQRRYYKQEIIQIGAVMLDVDNNEIASFSRNVRPKYSNAISSKVHSLIGLSYAQIAYSVELKTALAEFVEWCYRFDDDIAIYAWSNSDFSQLVNEIKYKDIDVSEQLLKLLGSWYDLQEEFGKIVGASQAIGLSKALNMCGFLFEGKQHDSLYDARNTSKIFIESRDGEQLLEFINKTSNYKTEKETCTLGNMIDFSQFYVLCDAE